MGMGRSGKRTLAVLVVAGLGLVLTACGGDDDDAAPAATCIDEKSRADIAHPGIVVDRRAGITLVHPADLPDLCCGTPWRSKGMKDGYAAMAARRPTAHLRVGPAGAIGAGQIEGFGNPVIRRGVQELRVV